jgi:hypothetical protein
VTPDAGARTPAEAREPPAAAPGRDGRGAALAELAAGVGGTVVLLYALRHALLSPVTRTFGHDLIFWYPVWQLYAEGLSLGELWLWNPFSYGGLTLYPCGP